MCLKIKSMKTKEELLKIFSAYLPYELQIQHSHIITKHKPETNLRPWVKTLEPFDLQCFLPDRNDKFQWIPILRPMDMLTKEIEHKGERFVPIEKLREINEDFKFGTTSDYYDNSDRLMFHFYNEYEIEVSFSDAIEIYKKLLEWHFNVFGLEESEYIKKETL